MKQSTPVYILFLASIVTIVLFLYTFGSFEIQDYPYLHQDFWRKYQDALFYLGDHEFPAFHPPLAPILFSLLISFNYSNFISINIIFLIIFVWSIFGITHKVSKNTWIALLASLLFLFSYANLYYTQFIGLYDFATAALISLSILIWLYYEENKKVLYLFIIGVTLGTASLIQYSGFFIVPVFLYLLWKYENNLKTKLLKIISLVLPVFIILAPFFVYRWIEFNDPFYSRVEHIELVTLYTEGLFYYIWFTIWYVSIPLIVLSIVGFISVRKEIEKVHYKLLLFVLPYFVFFTLLYQWTDPRFVMYWILPLFVLAGIGMFKSLQYVFTKTYYFLLPILLFVPFYTLLSPEGEKSIIIAPQTSILLDGSQRGDVSELFHFKVKHSSDWYSPIFFEMLDLNSNKNYELFYYSEIVNPVPVIEMSDFITNLRLENIGFELSKEQFVREQQFTTYLGKEIEIVNKDSLHSYIVTDTKKDQTALYSNSEFYLYENTKK